jgi:hypothetical protein
MSGRSAKKKKNWSAEEDQSGTFVEKMTPAWLKKELGRELSYKIYPWRSLSPRFMRWFVRPQFGGKAFLRLVYWLEEHFPRFFGKNGQYPLIVIKK